MKLLIMHIVVPVVIVWACGILAIVLGASTKVVLLIFIAGCVLGILGPFLPKLTLLGLELESALNNDYESYPDWVRKMVETRIRKAEQYCFRVDCEIERFRTALFGDRKQKKFLTLVIAMVAKLAQADGQVAKEERDRIKELFANRLHLAGKDVDIAFALFDEALSSTKTFLEYASDFEKEHHRDPGAR